MSQFQISVSFGELQTADLLPGAVYECDRANVRMTSGADPLPRLLGGIGNQGGFRLRAGREGGPVLMAITSSGSHADWPDEWDPETGTYTYFGDNRTPGRELHDTPRGGNKALRDMFGKSHASYQERVSSPVVLIFRKGPIGRDQEFIGMAVPGARGLSEQEDLVAIWRSRDGQRFQNYRAVFTVLDTGQVSGNWIRQGILRRKFDLDSVDTPDALRTWIENRLFVPRIVA